MQPDIKHVLFTSNLSDRSREVFKYAVTVADRFKARITILYVMEDEPPSVHALLGTVLSEEQLQELHDRHSHEAMVTLTGKSRQHSILREGLQMFSVEVSGTTKITHYQPDDIIITGGNVVDKILEIVEEKSCDLIVMGASQKGAISDMVLGGTVRGVVRGTKVPVFLAPVGDLS